MNKKKKRIRLAIYQSIMIGILFILLLVGMSILTNVEREQTENYPKVTEEVENYRSVVEKYAKEYGVEKHVDILLAMMMQESGGRGTDPMQSSESYCGQIGCIEDPELSIKQGVYYFSEVLDDADGDLKLAIQSYNFGRGFIDYVLEESGSYTQEVAIDFSQKMYENAPDKSIYTCLREEAKKYNACYGDIYYVNSVMQYSRTLAMQ